MSGIITAPEKRALYFGCWDELGHYLHERGGRTLYDPPAEFPWNNMATLDTGLLKHGRHPDVYDGKVFWTVGGKSFWYAFFWWDNSVDHRGGSHSGIYVCGFGWPQIQEAFDYGCAAFPSVVKRQRHPLVLQKPFPPKRAEVSP